MPTARTGSIFLSPRTVPRRVLKAVFIGTPLGTTLRKMSHAKVAPDGLKSQECERNAGRSKPPIPYITKKDVIQEVVDSSANTCS